MSALVHVTIALNSHTILLFQLKQSMTEQFIFNAFYEMGARPLGVRLMRNKYTNESAGFCFVSFQTGEQAINAMLNLNGKKIPGTEPTVLFWLINAKEQVPGTVSQQQQQHQLEQYHQDQRTQMKLKRQREIEEKLKEQQLVLKQQTELLHKQLHLQSQQLLLQKEEELFLMQQQQEEDEELVGMLRINGELS